MTLQTNSCGESSRGSGLALVGYRGTGKSTVGKLLANRLERLFLDADVELERRAGRSIPSIFAEWGEPVFRDWEERTLRELVGEYPGSVLATGGGVVLRPSNRALLREFGSVVWLQAEPSELARRLAAAERRGTNRPALTPTGTLAEVEKVLEGRIPLYREVSDLVVETSGRSPVEISEAILAAWAD